MSYELVAQHEKTNQLTFPGPRPSMNVGRCVGIAGCKTAQALVITSWLCHRATIIKNLQIPQTKSLVSWQLLSSEIGQATVLRGQLLQYTGIISEAISFHKGCINQNIISRRKCETM